MNSLIRRKLDNVIGLLSEGARLDAYETLLEAGSLALSSEKVSAENRRDLASLCEGMRECFGLGDSALA